MLNLYPTPTGSPPGTPVSVHRPLWIDLDRPSAEEQDWVAAEHGIRIPSHAQLQEIESSSRLRAQPRMLMLSVPFGIQDGPSTTPLPLGFVLTPELLVTIRYCDIHAFPDLRSRPREDQPGDSTGVFAALVEALVDAAADRLEQIAARLGGVSQNVFGPSAVKRRRRGLNRALQPMLLEVGQTGEQLSHIRETLVGLTRIATFAPESAREWLPEPVKLRLATVGHDLASLNDFESHLSGKVQFLLDAVLGFINTQQNDIFKVLTIVSVVGVPPTLIASIYGMNFHNMPEYNWPWGYQYGLAMILTSTLLPILWFKWRRWW
ncbi:MAG TPA: magnesium transporter CorA family protein [Steroidobacteraceae bacterium]|nr:magnesium transporter CorA family protein [Steroidobacteraceae bacterium]